MLVGESAATKQWTIGLNDEPSLYHLLMGRCAAVLRTSDFEKMCELQAADAMVDAERDLFTFAVECFYFSQVDEGIGAAGVVRTKIVQTWETIARAEGVQLCAGRTVSIASSKSKFAGHLAFPKWFDRAGVAPYACRLKSQALRPAEAFSVSRTFIQASSSFFFSISASFISGQRPRATAERRAR